MQELTASNLRSAFGGESMAHMRYKIWADKAAQEGFPNVARLFTAISRAEQVHATGHFKALARVGGAFLCASGGGFGLTDTSANLAGAIEGETFEVESMYPAYLAEARRQGEAAAEKSCLYAWEAEKIHAAMFAKARRAVGSGKDVKLGTVQICLVCGHTVEGDAPDKCPICSAVKSKFVAFA
ncbi:MAG TPA: rubrerythrin family protein [Phycisphaerae bacterium]|nr:rubrerythrin family protein [Phycisphaerae bacterium]